MCRYAMYGPYKNHYACFSCRKMFRKHATGPSKCPQCGGTMHPMGLDFKAPPVSNTKAWEAVRTLYRNGIRYSSCGCNGPGYRPSHPRDARAFIAEIQDAASRTETAIIGTGKSKLTEWPYFSPRKELTHRKRKGKLLPNPPFDQF